MERKQMRLIDADALRETMFHRAFEMDSDMQKWDGGCWIRYKMFENALENAQTIEVALIVGERIIVGARMDLDEVNNETN